MCAVSCAPSPRMFSEYLFVVLVVCVRCQLCSESFDVLRMSFCSSWCLCVVSVVFKCAFGVF